MSSSNLPATTSATAAATAADTAEAPPFRALSDLIAGHAQAAPQRPALVAGAQSLTYGALNARMNQVAAALQRDGLAPQDSIAICASSSVDYMVVFLGALRAGVAVAPLAPSSTAAQLAGMAADAGARHFFADAGVAQALDSAGVALAAGTQRILLDDSRVDDHANRRHADLRLADWLAPAGTLPTPVDVQPQWPFNIIYSSGTTGTPKGIVQPHGMRWSHVVRAAASGYDLQAVTLIATPLYSNTTLVSVFPTLAGGGCVVMMPKFDVVNYLSLAQAHHASHTMLVPVQYQRLMAHPDFDHYDLSSFRYKFCTSAPFHAALKADIVARWPGALIEYYGMTEGGGTCMLAAHLHPTKLHTVGQPVEGHDIRLIDEQGHEVAPGEAGEVVGRSGAMMNGYHNQPAKTAEAEWHDARGQRYIRTGDIGRFDADGFLTLFDRKKDMIISGGFNVYPSDLEAVMRQHPAVADAAVVGVPSEAWGETPVAYVVRRAGSDMSADALRNEINQQLGKTQRLADLLLLNELPRSAIGKVLKRELRDAYAAGH